MTEPSWATLKQIVHERAQGCCEYCQSAELNTGQIMQVDHIDPFGDDALDNLCLACWHCNNHKKQATEADDPETGETVALFNPRQQAWRDHFRWVDTYTRIIGLSPTGRATVKRLKMNRPIVVVARDRWVKGGYHPPAHLHPPDAPAP